MAQVQPDFGDYVAPSNCVTLTRYFYSPVERPTAMLCTQLQQAERVIAACVIRPLQLHQQDALLCLVSDIVGGLAAAPSTTFEKSVLVTALNRGMLQIAAGEFYTFCYVQGRVQTRAWEKRGAEQLLFARGKLLFD